MLKLQPSIISAPTFRHTSFETAITFNRSDGRQVTMTLLHEEPGWPPELIIASMRIRNNPNNNPSEQVVLSVAEARLLRDLLSRPEVAALLDEE